MNPQEILALVAVFNALEPKIQQGIAALVHKLHSSHKSAGVKVAVIQKAVDSVDRDPSDLEN